VLYAIHLYCHISGAKFAIVSIDFEPSDVSAGGPSEEAFTVALSTHDWCIR